MRTSGEALGDPHAYSLQDRYLKEEGTLYLSGLQALVRMLVDQVRHDRTRGHDIAGLVTGYEGSPLAGYDLELIRQRDLLARHGIVHQPGLNEEMAVTAIVGTQLAGEVGRPRHDGVFGFWYGKAPGLDRASDALRHANLVGTDPRGGAVCLVGDDAAAKSSTVPSASEAALADLMLPTFSPAGPGEVLVHGRHALELSRASGLWTALKIATNVADGSATVSASSSLPAVELAGLPEALTPYRHRPNAKLRPPFLAELEAGLHAVRMPIAVEYIRRSGVNEIIDRGTSRVGVVASGKTYLDVCQSLDQLGLLHESPPGDGIRLLKLGAVFPVEPEVVRQFAEGLERIIVVEEKRGLIEDAIKAILYHRASAPSIHGKLGSDQQVLFSAAGELDPDVIAEALHRQLRLFGISTTAPPVAHPGRLRTLLPIAPRTPYFCSGCPHNSSTKTAPGSLVGGGIGCHAMVLVMSPDQVGNVTGVTQMGGEGAHWIGMAPFVEQDHFVQNLGDGTFSHSGSLAVRAAVASGANVTFKLLRNSAVAMTGGQEAVGALPLDRLVHLLEAEGVERIAVTSDDPAAVRRRLPGGVEVRHRRDLVTVEQELAAVPGVTVLIHDQECAAEVRRRRRRGLAPAPARRAVINERLCEGCGDCGKKSNCLSVQPVHTEFGRKTRIDQDSCNVDLACLEGDCPSFMTVRPGKRAAQRPLEVEPPSDPPQLFAADGFAVRIVGAGGTGVVTLAQILATAAVLEGRSVRALDQTGLAQKGGAVVSDVKISGAPTEQASKLAREECALYLGCDALAAADPRHLVAAGPRSVAVVSTTEVATGQMVADVTAVFPPEERITAAIADRVSALHAIDAAHLARRLVGDAQHANTLLLGVAYQAGAVPIAAASIERAIRLNGVAVDANIAAFRHGRAEYGDPTNLEVPAGGPAREPAELVASRSSELAAYQNEAYAQRYRDVVTRVQERESALSGDGRLATAVADNLFKLMAYKDEYEVARLAIDPAVAAAVTAQFGVGSRITYLLHPPLLRVLGLRRKLALGAWMRPIFRMLVVGRRLRGTPFDPFGRTQVRRLERSLITEYESVVETLLAGLGANTLDLAVEIAGTPDVIRGYEEVKLASVARYRALVEARLADFGTLVGADR